jgi:glutathione peroxidase
VNAVAVAIAALATLIVLLSRRGRRMNEVTPTSSAPSLYELATRSLAGEPAPLATYRGAVSLAVNVASRCGLTPQYEGLQRLHEELSPRGFTVLGFPSNDFLGQEPGTPAEIRDFCTTAYGVTFPLFAKRAVKGEAKDEVYRLLCRDLPEPSWNFTKYLVGRDGRVLARFDPKTSPDDPALRAAIDRALAAPRP